MATTSDPDMQRHQPPRPDSTAIIQHRIGAGKSSQVTAHLLQAPRSLHGAVVLSCKNDGTSKADPASGGAP